MKKMVKSMKSFLFYTIFLFYIYLLLDLLIFKYISPMELFDSNRYFMRDVNLIPFHTISNYLFGGFDVSWSVASSNVFGNILIFIPLGIYLYILKKNMKLSTSLLWIFLTSLSAEMIQYILGVGSSDIDDIILNFSGGAIGILLYKVLYFAFKSETRVKTVITITSSVIGLPILVMYILVTIANS